MLEVPKPAVLTKLLDRWAADRKRARVLLLLDVSGSMGEPGDRRQRRRPSSTWPRQAISGALDEFERDDEVGLRIFSTNLGDGQDHDWLDLVPISPVAGNGEAMRQRIGGLAPTNGTPLYTSTSDAYDDMVEGFDPERINAVVLLTDGRNDDDRNNDLERLLDRLRSQTEGETATPVRVFAIAYGADADLETLRRIAEATNAQRLRRLGPDDDLEGVRVRRQQLLSAVDR